MKNEAQKFCDLGKQFLDRGEPEEALRCYERAIDVDPENPDAWCGRGKAAYDMGRLERADRDYKRALRLAARELGDTKKPRRWWADSTTRPYLRALHGHGLCRFWLGMYEDAAKTFRRLLRLAPTDPLDVRFLVGETYLRMGRIERAIHELERAEDDTDALFNLGLARFYSGDFVGSVNAFRRGIFANLHLEPLLSETPAPRVDGDGDSGEDEAGNAKGERVARSEPKESKRREVPTDSGTHPKGLDSDAAANDYVDRCGDLWFGRPVVQRWLHEIAEHATVKEDLAKHLEQLHALSGEKITHGERARIEGQNTTLRSGERLSGTDRAIAADILSRIFVLPPAS
jgi:tetratricopeptide (TPR) repeat protein